ncbi:MAG: glycosyltransferase [Labilithrix sp.]|nr:glycosyltransferase [Labilithrix sp.]MCW5814476.1 glycosyltransferase [Labilithrix sp.]
MISVLLPYRNAVGTLDEAIGSIRADLGGEDEMVLVDDGSTDGGAAIAARYAGPRVIQVTTPGVGIAAALNVGLTRCRGRYVARMDADDVSLPGRLAASRALLDRDPALAVAAVRVELFGSPAAGMERYVAWQNGIVTAEEHASAIFVEAPVCHPATLIRRESLAAVGGYRDGHFAEDYDLWLRIVAAGMGIAKVPTVLFRWRIHPGSLTWSHARYSADAHRKLRAGYLAARLPGPFALWGAGAAGRRLARELEAHGPRPDFFIDIDPKKIGRTARARPILALDDGLARARAEGLFVIVALAAPGARDLARARLAAGGFREGSDYLCGC